VFTHRCHQHWHTHWEVFDMVSRVCRFCSRFFVVCAEKIYK